MQRPANKRRARRLARTLPDKTEPVDVRIRNGHAPMGFKLVGHKVRGKWIHATIAPDPEQRRIMGEIVRVRDKYKWTFDAIGDYIDQWLAETEGRKRTPRWEREWSSQRCRRAYYVEVALRKEATSQPPSASS